MSRNMRTKAITIILHQIHNFGKMLPWQPVKHHLCSPHNCWCLLFWYDCGFAINQYYGTVDDDYEKE